MKIASLKSTLSELDEQLRQTSSKFVSCRDTTLEKEAEANKMRLIAEQAERSVEDCQRQLARKNDDLRENDEKIQTLEQKIGKCHLYFLCGIDVLLTGDFLSCVENGTSENLI